MYKTTDLEVTQTKYKGEQAQGPTNIQKNTDLDVTQTKNKRKHLEFTETNKKESRLMWWSERAPPG